MNYAIIVAAGSGKRMNSAVNKMLFLLDSKPLVYHSIIPFEKSQFVDEIIIAANKGNIESITSMVKRENISKVKKIILGGEKRQDSVYAAIKELKAKSDDIIIIHNGANPFVTETAVASIINAAAEHGSSASAVKPRDTIKEANEDNIVIQTLDRSKLWHMQTPQAARYDILARAYVKAYNDEFYGTDDAQLIERIGERVKIVECDRDNFKITTYSDLENARLLIYADRAGIGQDSHPFDESKNLILGATRIPGCPGLKANSDGDVILHALFNALSQSIGGKSLGFYADPLCGKGITDSAVYLKIALDMIKERNLEIKNIGIMLECKKPRLEKYEELIKENIAKLCELSISQIGLTATSGEDLTPWGKGKGIQCFCLALLKNKSKPF